MWGCLTLERQPCYFPTRYERRHIQGCKIQRQDVQRIATVTQNLNLQVSAAGLQKGEAGLGLPDTETAFGASSVAATGGLRVAREVPPPPIQPALPVPNPDFLVSVMLPGCRDNSPHSFHSAVFPPHELSFIPITGDGAYECRYVCARHRGGDWG